MNVILERKTFKSLSPSSELLIVNRYPSDSWLNESIFLEGEIVVKNAEYA